LLTEELVLVLDEFLFGNLSGPIIIALFENSENVVHKLSILFLFLHRSDNLANHPDEHVEKSPAPEHHIENKQSAHELIVGDSLPDKRELVVINNKLDQTQGRGGYRAEKLFCVVFFLLGLLYLFSICSALLLLFYLPGLDLGLTPLGEND